MRLSLKAVYTIIFNILLLSSCTNNDIDDVEVANTDDVTPIEVVSTEPMTNIDGFTTNDTKTVLPETTFGNETNCSQSEDDVFNAAFIVLVNKHRESINLNPLMEGTVANYLAFKHSKHMICQNDFNHSNFNETNNILSREVNSRGAAENIIQGYNTPERMLEGWLNSPPHKMSIENPSYTHTGFSAVKANGRYWGTQIFYR